MRDGDKRIVRLKEGSPKGRHVVIVDDLVQSGGTLIECQRLLKTQARLCAITSGEEQYYTIKAQCINTLTWSAGYQHILALTSVLFRQNEHRVQAPRLQWPSGCGAYASPMREIFVKHIEVVRCFVLS